MVSRRERGTRKQKEKLHKQRKKHTSDIKDQVIVTCGDEAPFGITLKTKVLIFVEGVDGS